MPKVFAIRVHPSKIPGIIEILKRKGIDFSKTAFSDYLIVYHKDPTEDVKGIQGVKVIEITGQHYLGMLEDKVFFDRIFSEIRTGDLVQVTDGEYKGATGVVEKIKKPTATVLLTVWGLPHRVELPLKDLRKIVDKLE